jgi:V-type H+-transporting ATPase subunit C
MANSFWFISVPAHGNPEAVYSETKSLTASFGSPCFKFDIPKLKVGTLDALMVLSDEIAKFDQHADVALRRVVRAWENDVTDDTDVTKASDLGVDMGGDRGGDANPISALKSFSWAEERFPVKTNLSEMASTIYGQICDVDEEVKTSLANFSQIRNALNTLKRKAGGNLLVRDLNGIVEARHYCLKPDGEPSEKITPVFVCVPKHKWEEFGNTYETFTREVVPGSKKVVQEDDSYVLCRVLHLDCPSLQSYKEKCTSEKYNVREFVYDAQAVDDNAEEKAKLLESERHAKIAAKKTLQTAFSEIFVLHVHLKAVRTFVESALWYSLPLNFQAMLIEVNPRKEAALQTALNKKFANAKGSAPTADDDDHAEVPFLQFPYLLEFLAGEK